MNSNFNLPTNTMVQTVWLAPLVEPHKDSSNCLRFHSTALGAKSVARGPKQQLCGGRSCIVQSKDAASLPLLTLNFVVLGLDCALVDHYLGVVGHGTLVSGNSQYYSYCGTMETTAIARTRTAIFCTYSKTMAEEEEVSAVAHGNMQ
jgi:hypothetical protein